MQQSLKAPEPSMEEILASIRKIIADDPPVPSAAPPAAPAALARPLSDPGTGTAFSPSAGPSAAAAPTAFRPADRRSAAELDRELADLLGEAPAQRAGPTTPTAPVPQATQVTPESGPSGSNHATNPESPGPGMSNPGISGQPADSRAASGSPARHATAAAAASDGVAAAGPFADRVETPQQSVQPQGPAAASSTSPFAGAQAGQSRFGWMRVRPTGGASTTQSTAAPAVNAAAKSDGIAPQQVMGAPDGVQQAPSSAEKPTARPSADVRALNALAATPSVVGAPDVTARTATPAEGGADGAYPGGADTTDAHVHQLSRLVLPRPNGAAAGEAPSPDGAAPQPLAGEHQAQGVTAPNNSFAASPTVGVEATASPVTSTSPRSVEDTLAELLRPMVRQWLDENMTRAIEKAIRVEIASSLRPQVQGNSGKSNGKS